MNCHSVRQLAVCSGCHQLGSKLHMIPTDSAWFHGRCYIIEFGDDRFLALPPSHTGPITLDDIGVDMMRRLLDGQKDSPNGR